MTKIEFGFSLKDSHDFVIKNEKWTREVEGKKVSGRKQVALYKNPEIDAWSCVQRLTAENAPAALKNIQYFEAPNPFGKFGLGKQYEPYGWTLTMALLAFKKGYIDGWLSGSGGLFQPFGTLNTEGIIVVDPVQRIEVRKYFEKEFFTFLDNCNEEDFDYGIVTNWGYGARLGKSKRDGSITDVIERLKREHEEEGEEFFKTESEQTAVQEHGFDKVLFALGALIYYDTDLWNLWGQRTAEPLTFQSKEDAEAFKAQYKEWEVTYRDGEKKSLDVAPVNEVFENWLRNRKAA